MTGDTALAELKSCRSFKSVMLVGHEPDFSGLRAAPARPRRSATLRIRKASLTQLDCRRSAQAWPPCIFNPMQTDDLKPRIIHARDFAGESADLILEHAYAALAARGTFRLGLAGGNTPRKIHHELVQRAGSDFPWEKLVITFGDERCVPPDHADSNYLMAKESLLDHVPISPANVLRMRGETDPELGAADMKLSCRGRRVALERASIRTICCYSAWAATVTQPRYFPAPLLWKSRRAWCCR
jgi:hypothetical protein